MNILQHKKIIILLLYVLSSYTFVIAENLGSLLGAKILNQHSASISLRGKIKLSTSVPDSLIWCSTDSNIITVRNSIVHAKSLGTAKVIVQNLDGSSLDTCSVTVVPWIAGMTNLQAVPILTKLRLVAIRNDTLYMQGEGGSYGWSALYMYTEGMSAPRMISDFESDNTFPYDPESLLPTPFGAFVLAKREHVNVPRKIYKLNLSQPTTKLVYDQFPPNPLSPNQSQVMQQGWNFDDSGNVYLGEYTDNVSTPYQIKIFKGSNFGESWKDVYTFPISTVEGDTGGIRHIHACEVDPYTGDIWIATGDEDWQCRIYYNKNHLSPDSTGSVNLNLVGIGSQEYRAVCLDFTEKYIYWFMDAPCNSQKIFRIQRSDSYPTLTRHPAPGTDYRELVGTFTDKPFRNSIVIRDGAVNTIIVATEFEDAEHYGCTFREIDKLDRMIGIRENADGSMQIQELFNSPALQLFNYLLPVGTDSKGYIYYNSTCDGYTDRPQIYKAKFIWNDVDELFVPTSDTTVSFPNTKIKLSGNFLTPQKIIAACQDSIAFPGELPDSILSISPDYWIVDLAVDSFNNGSISVKISDIHGLDDKDSLTWLARKDPGDDWTNIGGIVKGINLKSTQSFSNYSEFAIGSYKLTTNVVNNYTPTGFSLSQNYPNPFNNSTSISFYVPYSVIGSVKIYDILGRKISEISNRRYDEGYQRVTWDASDVASGIYLYRFDAASISQPNKVFTQIKKMILMK